MSQGLCALVCRLIISVCALCIGLGAMGVDVIGTMGIGDMVVVLRYVVGVAGLLSMYALLKSCCSSCGSCRV